MFKHTKAFSSFAVPDIEQAKHFYGDILRLEVTEAHGMLELHIEGGNPVLIYPKQDFVPATYTVLNFPVEDIADVVASLKSLDVPFESYDGDIRTDENNIHQYGNLKNAWFTDPAGNILSLVEGSM